MSGFEAGRTAHHASENKQPLPREAYNVGWVCALFIEMAAAVAMLDEQHGPLPLIEGDNNSYELGSIHSHNVVIACLPCGHYGTNNAASLARDMQRSFPCLAVRLMVGIGGGVPGSIDLRLGDIVVGTTVTQYDLGKELSNGDFETTSHPVRLPTNLSTSLSRLRARHEIHPPRFGERISAMITIDKKLKSSYARPGPETDRLFEAAYNHDPRADDCEDCDQSKILPHTLRPDNEPKIHYGDVASGNRVIKAASVRDRISQQSNALCFEMESAGLIDHFPCLVIRGICDYSDSHKAKNWQRYAAAVAAAYARDFLFTVYNSLETQNSKVLPVQDSGKSDCLGDLLQERDDLIKLLQFAQIDNRRLNIKSATLGTCGWILQHPVYKEWLTTEVHGNHHGFLWINGKAGTGKSTLMNFLYSNAAKATDVYGTTISFFFNARGDDLEKSTMGMYRTLLVQLLREFPDVVAKVEGMQSVLRKAYLGAPWRIEQLARLFHEVVLALGNRRVTCFIDALDECAEQEVREMIANIDELGHYTAELEIQFFTCFSSRPYPAISLRSGLRFGLWAQSEHTKDLKRYVENALKPPHAEFITDIVQKASGIFLWAVLVVRLINQDFDKGYTKQFIKKRLSTIPHGLGDLFRQILTRDSIDRDRLLVCLQLMLFTKRTLSPDELYLAMLSNENVDCGEFEWEEMHSATNLVHRFLLSSSKGLIEIVRGVGGDTVQFIHEAVPDFLIKDGGVYELWPELDRCTFEAQSHDKIKACCENYINSRWPEVDRLVDIKELFDANLGPCNRFQAGGSLFQKFVETFKSYPFLLYAVAEMWYHADKASTCISQRVFASNPFYTNQRLQLFSFCASYITYNFGDYYELVVPKSPYTLSHLGYSALIEDLPRQSLTLEGGGEWKYPLFTALARRDASTVRALLRQKDIIPYGHDIPLQLDYGNELVRTWSPDISIARWALDAGHLSLIELLLKSGDIAAAELDKTRYPWWPQLVAAIKSQDVDSVKDILESSQLCYIKLHFRSFLSDSLLDIATSYGNEAVIKALVRAGCSMHNYLLDTKEWADPWRVCSRGHSKAVESLLGVDLRILAVNSPDPCHRCSPIDVAVRAGHVDAVKRLLALPEIDLNLKERTGRSLLAMAIEFNHKNVLEILLGDDRIDVNELNEQGKTPLKQACIRGDLEAVTLLLAIDRVDREAPDNLGITTIHEAVMHSQEDVLQALIRTSGIDVNQVSGYPFAMTPLHQAVMVNSPTIVMKLLSSPRININIPGHEKMTPLLMAVKYLSDDYFNGWGEDLESKATIIMLLLSCEGVDVNASDDEGFTALHYTVIRKPPNTKILQLLLWHPCIDLARKDHGGRTAMDFAKLLRSLYGREMGPDPARIPNLLAGVGLFAGRGSQFEPSYTCITEDSDDYDDYDACIELLSTAETKKLGL